jgi:flagellar biosynthesis/type III secretory pathway M-ring protein FliF/YscJ
MTNFVDSSKTIEIKIDKYALLAGMLVETSQLLTAILIVLIVVLLLVLEIIRRRRHKPQESEKLKSE